VLAPTSWVPDRRLEILMAEASFDVVGDETFDVIEGKATYSLNE